MPHKIAFCFSGQARTLDQTYKIFQSNLFDAAKKQGFEYDVFCAVEDDKDVDKINILHPTTTIKIKSADVEKLIDKKYGNFIKNVFPYKYGALGYTKYCYNSLQQIYKISKSIELKNKYEFYNNVEYDIVFKLRFDAPFPNKIDFNAILKELRKHDTCVICNKYKYSKLTKLAGADSIDDIYFILNNAASKVFADMFDKWLNCFEGKEITKNIWLHNVFNKILKKNNESVEKYKIKYKNKRILAYILVLKLYSVMFFYTKFFMRQDNERWFLSFFEYNNFTIVKDQISIRIMKESDFFSVKGLFKKTKYEL